MIKFIINRIAYALLVLWGVLSIVFFLFNILPGDPARMMLDKREDSEQLLVIKHKYGFDRTFLEQYLLYINDISPISFHYHHQDAFTSLSKRWDRTFCMFTCMTLVFLFVFEAIYTLRSTHYIS